MTKIEIENVGQPGATYRVDADKFHEMQRVTHLICPKAPPGETPKALIAAALPHLDPTLFPEGATAGWWFKAVQLDMEAKGSMARAGKPPVRLWLT
jgi:hypothetical protein